MLSNRELGELFGELANLMELHGENEFKIRTYANAYLNIKKIDIPLLDKSNDELLQIPVLGKAVVEKIVELSRNGKIEVLEELRKKTPEGVRQMFKIKGVGPKKVKVFWKDMGFENLGELYYACKENRLILQKGFGPKIQDDIIQAIDFFQSNQNNFLFPKLHREAETMIQELINLNPGNRFEFTGDLRRLIPIQTKIEILSSSSTISLPELFNLNEKNDQRILGTWNEHFPVLIHLCTFEKFYSELFKTTGGSDIFRSMLSSDSNKVYKSEEEIFSDYKISFIPPECRDLNNYKDFDADQLISVNDIKGVVHCHSTYSDGTYDLRTMAKECIRLGYEYLVISDHSKTAVYANGLPIERVEMQWREIDQLNKELAPFTIFKSIESDILSDGSLDYPDDILAGFDLVIASIHSNLNMELEKAMLRLIRAIENPYTKILGHLTGRLLLSRQGYPVDHQKIIDACSANGVSIEINANPLRLDMDWTWIPYAMEKEVLISINPDAHNLKGIDDIKFGVMAARKGGLTRDKCLNSFDLEEFKCWINVNK